MWIISAIISGNVINSLDFFFFNSYDNKQVFTVNFFITIRGELNVETLDAEMINERTVWVFDLCSCFSDVARSASGIIYPPKELS